MSDETKNDSENSRLAPVERPVRRGIQEEDILAEDMETAYLIIDLVKERDIYREALETAWEAMRERRGYLAEWEWKYEEDWDTEDAKVKAALGSA